jgi:peptidoglycan hydrolase-like protein with peptidoglycan-binding domain
MFGYTMVKIQRIGLVAALIICCINTPSAFAQTSVSQNKSEQIRTIIQPLLSELGYYNGPIDGINGSKTRLAILNFEFSISNSADGYLNGYEISELRRATSITSPEANTPQPTVETQSTQDKLKIRSLESKFAEAKQTVERERVVNAELVSQLTEVLNDLTHLRELQAETANEGLKSRAQVDALNNTLADYVNGLALNEKIIEIENQKDAANEALVDLRQRLESEFVPKNNLVSAQDQIDAANKALVDLRQRLESEFVPKNNLVSAQDQIAALNSTLTDKRVEIDSKYISLEKHQSMQANLRGDVRDRQTTIDSLNQTLSDAAASAEAKRARHVNALNGTLVELQEKIQLLDKRKTELWVTLNSFLTDCKSSTACALELGLD